MLNADTGLTRQGREQPASWQVEALLSLNGCDRKWLAAELEVTLLTVNRWFSGDRGCGPQQRRRIYDLMRIPMKVAWFPERRVIANGSDQGRFEGKTARESLESWVKDSGYRSLHEMELATQPGPGEWVKVLSPEGDERADLEIDSFEELIAAVKALPDDNKADFLRTAGMELRDVFDDDRGARE